MAIEKFKFVSPGVQINEIDESIIPPAQPSVGPVIIGNTLKGPAMEPVMVSSVSELERVFGPAFNGNVGSTDVWRSGLPTAPTLATYAAKAFLKNAAPVTVIRLAGVPLAAEDDDTGTSVPGWNVSKVYELYAVEENASELTGTLVANIYTDGNAVAGVGVDGDGLFDIDGAKITIGTSITHSISFNFASSSFIRNVLNTNPTKYADLGYFLGESFESHVTADQTKFKLVEQIAGVTTRRVEAGALAARSSTVISQLSDAYVRSYQALFHFESLEKGSYPSKEVKISIENVKESKNPSVTKYGTFDVVIRPLKETASKTVFERFSGLNLDPSSDNYIVKKIGDLRRSWDPDNQRYVEEGTFANRSAYVRVVMSDSDIPATALPMGFVKPSSTAATNTLLDKVILPDISFVDSVPVVSSKNKRFGFDSSKASTDDIVDVLRYKARNYDTQNIFHAEYISKDGTSYEYTQDSYSTEKVLLSGLIAGFDVPMYDGFDAKDITKVEPFMSKYLLGGSSVTNPAQRAVKQALDMASQSDLLDMNLLCVPGLQSSVLTNRMLEICKSRGDSIALIDLDGDYEYPHDNDNNKEVRPSSVTDVITGVKSEEYDNSYGAAYFPAVFVASEGIFLPASIAALGALGGTEGRSALWFAPAGFNRGGLTELTSGIGVSRTALHLTSTDRDELYEVNINPIATFPNEGVVIFGQKTLQSTPSALDRVNVRRLVNHIKKFISRASTRVLFEPNVESTWNSFKQQVEPFLESIKTNFGLDDAKVVLDSSTTTADLIDRNIMYCKVMLKPTRAIEYIAIDLAVTNSGAAFTE